MLSMCSSLGFVEFARTFHGIFPKKVEIFPKFGIAKAPSKFFSKGGKEGQGGGVETQELGRGSLCPVVPHLHRMLWDVPK